MTCPVALFSLLIREKKKTRPPNEAGPNAQIN